MISRYIYAGLGISMIALGAWVFYLNGVIEDKNIEIGRIEVQLIACEASADRLIDSLEHQNDIIDEFNARLTKVNTEMKSISMDNSNLKRVVEEKVILLNKVEVKTCEETIDWLLDSALAKP